MKTTTKYEYYVKFWGGRAEKVMEKLGLEGQDHWFDTEAESKAFMEKLVDANGGLEGLALTVYEGTDVRKRTVAYLHLRYKNKDYHIREDFGYGYPVESAYFMFSEGNYSCDCNLSLFIRRQCDPDFEPLDCGGEIEVGKFDVFQEEPANS